MEGPVRVELTSLLLAAKSNSIAPNTPSSQAPSDLNRVDVAVNRRTSAPDPDVDRCVSMRDAGGPPSNRISNDGILLCFITLAHSWIRPHGVAVAIRRIVQQCADFTSARVSFPRLRVFSHYHTVITNGRRTCTADRLSAAPKHQSTVVVDPAGSGLRPPRRAKTTLIGGLEVRMLQLY